MKKLLFHSKNKIGKAPGDLSYIGKSIDQEATISTWEYDKSDVKHTKASGNFKSLQINPDKNQWFHINGIHNVEALKKIGDQFSIHTLFLEDILNPSQRPKVERIENNFFASMKLLQVDENNQVISNNITFIISDNNLFTFSEFDQNDWINPVVKRLEDKQRQIRKKNIYYLLYALMDVLVDHYFWVLEEMGATVEYIDKDIFINTNAQHLDQLYELKKQFLFIRKQTAPVNELIHKMPNEVPVKDWESVRIFFDDLLDHTTQVQETTKTYLDALANLFDLYFSLTNEKMNRTIQMLTIITVVFLPLTLLTGMYGMNFVDMPGLQAPHGFAVIVLTMVGLTAAILAFLKHKKWF